jgi:putative selenium metabolism protein SsnA
MSHRTLLGNGMVVTGYGPAARVITGGAVLWEGERILTVGPEAELRLAYPDAHWFDAHGGMILPGLVNLHHHFYSALARGLDPGVPLRNFTETLDGLWWRLDRALAPETVTLSAQLSATDCIRWGCTTVFDHHASPSCIAGSLDRIAEALTHAGLSAVLCYEVTDRNGREGARAGIEENLRFLRQQEKHPRIRGVFGLHASFTLSDESLRDVAEHRPAGAGCHIHAAEDAVDVEVSQKLFSLGPVQRLERFGLLDERALLAHCIHLREADYDEIAKHGATVIHNPESNANNGVGSLQLANVAAQGCCVGLGTDGMSSSMLRALRAAHLTHRALGGTFETGAKALSALLHNNAQLAGRFLDEPLLGELVSGAPADVIVLDCPPPTPICSVNLLSHLVFGMSEAAVRHTVARGKILREDYVARTLDAARMAARARELSPALWQRFHAQPRGTDFFGRAMSVHGRSGKE